MTLDTQLVAVRTAFAERFAAPPHYIIRSPGRVNLIGEHTDYNDGWAFPAALDLGTWVAIGPRDDGQLITVAPRMQGEDRADLAELLPNAELAEWARYVRGVAALLQGMGQPLAGANLYIDGNLPLGSGLSSSASLELGVAMALLELGGVRFDLRALARLGQRVENEIIGVKSGIMDQLAVAGGVAGHALLLDCRIMALQPVAIPSDLRILVFDSAVPRTLAGSAYNQRRAECEAALRELQVLQPNLRALRDVEPAMLAAAEARLEPLIFQRARHVVSENQRVLASVAALQRGESAIFGRLMNESHASLRDDYAVSGPELDQLVAIATATPGIYGARLTGAGFGGCVVALADAAQAATAADAVISAYREQTGKPGQAFVTVPSAGTAVVWSA